MHPKLIPSSLTLLILPLLIAAPASAEVLSVKTATANFRESPSEAAAIKFTADKFYPVEVVEKKAGWVKVKDFEGDEAWVAEKVLDQQPSIVIQVERANVRETPSTTADVSFKVERGEVFKIVEQKGEWLRVLDARGDGGWIRNDLTWGEPAPQKVDQETKPDTLVTGGEKTDASKQAPVVEVKDAKETGDKKDAALVSAAATKAIDASLELTSQANVEALCRTYLARIEENKTTAPRSEKPAATQKKPEAKPAVTEKKADKKAEAPKATEEKKADKKATPAPKKS